MMQQDHIKDIKDPNHKGGLLKQEKLSRVKVKIEKRIDLNG